MSIQVTLRGAIEALQTEVARMGQDFQSLPFGLIDPRMRALQSILGQFIIVECELEDALGLHEPGAALTPAPVEAEPGIPDALGEFMKREGAVEWGGGECPTDWNTDVEVLFLSGDTHIGPAGARDWSGNSSFAHDVIIAYRIISEPAAGEGEAAPDEEVGGLDGAAYKAGRDAFVHGHERDVPHNYSKHGLTNSWLNGWDYEAEVARLLAEPVTPPDAEINSGPFENDGEPAGEGETIAHRIDLTPPTPPAFLEEVSDYFPTQPFTIGASKLHAEESAALAPLLPPEPPKPATPEEMMACGYVNDEASWWSRKMAKENA